MSFFVIALLALPPGRYVGETAQGVVDLELRADGTATFGGAAFKWSATQRSLDLIGTKTYSFDLKANPVGGELSGGPFGTIYLRRIPADEPVFEPPPAPRRTNPVWVGAWRHTASGGSVTFDLAADGSYRLVQSLTGSPEQSTQGKWWAEPNALVLSPSPKVMLRYTVKQLEGALEIGGGDLPFPVRFGRAPAP